MESFASPRAVVIISSGQEWRAAKAFYPRADMQTSPYGEWFYENCAGWRLVLAHGGVGKVPAAASAEYLLASWQPDLLVNLGTCGGFRGRIERGQVILVERTVIYDIVELMSDAEAAIQRYRSEIDLSWLAEPYPEPVHRGLMASADRDIVVEDIPRLEAKYGAVAGDWESGAIAWVAARRGARCLILRGVSDLIGEDGGDAYSDYAVYTSGAREIITRLLEQLPRWLGCVKSPAA